MTIRYAQNQADARAVLEHLQGCDPSFVDALTARVTLSDYAGKLAKKAERFEAFEGGTLVGLVAVYCNSADRQVAFVSNVSVWPAMLRQGIADTLMRRAIAHVTSLGFEALALEVAVSATAARALYTKLGFQADGATGMRLDIA